MVKGLSEKARLSITSTGGGRCCEASLKFESLLVCWFGMLAALGSRQPVSDFLGS